MEEYDDIKARIDGLIEIGISENGRIEKYECGEIKIINKTFICTGDSIALQRNLKDDR